MMTPSLPRQRWKIAPEDLQAVQTLVTETGLSSLLAQVLINRGITTPALAQIYCQPESQRLPDPLMEFPDLSKSVELLTIAIREKQKIAICGDYDADGMTSTALLLRALRHLGADVDYAIPSRMKDGYGINERIVREFAASGIQLILTVDNGIYRKSLAIYYLRDPASDADVRQRALFVPRENQRGDEEVLETIRLRSNVNTSSKAYRR
jgi:single-stranded-DNA-specific exonuclease